ncbi:FecR family protein [Candidatus Aminicenantes bacterium AC-708-M15]|jgi:hypothetical protein|nr:FecR family protein [SCandidatus Aminicenantes bacterium Aminicenantia_JdfR_composite]MCP2596939.1 FecR family protein [Candidatus Aminicenantes bacterium AC-335-G13]MCP2603983.1 FecR family protein [Candidatus Aminicenantes bacterium AC-708-M15]
MRKKCILIFSIILILTPLLIYSFNEEKYYFGYITYTEKGCKIKRSSSPQFEEVILNFPVIPRDEIYTSKGRCEIQFDNGTIVRLDKNTELKIETIMAQSLTSRWKITTLLLNRGKVYVMNRNYNRELFQFITPNTAIKLKDDSVSKIEVNERGETYFQVIKGKGYIQYGPSEKELKKVEVKKSERVFVNSNHRLISRELVIDSDFDLWNEIMNEHFKEIHFGRSKVPEPIYRYPRAVIYFAQKYSSMYGEWIYTDLFGYVWRPYYSNYYPSGWMPYRYGRWVLINGELFWVPAEPWGWVPYHFGVWHWTEKWGWIWIPGSAFHYGMVDWFYSGLYIGWRPWTLWDYWFWYGYWSYPDYYYWYAWYYSRYENIPGEEVSVPYKRRIRQRISKEELKSPKRKPYKLPEEYKKIVKNLIFSSNEIKKTILHPPHLIVNQYLFIKKTDILSPELSKKVIPYSEAKDKIKINPLGKIFKKQVFSSFLVKRIAQLQLINSIIYSNERTESYQKIPESLDIGKRMKEASKKSNRGDNKQNISISLREFLDVMPEISKEKSLTKNRIPSSRMRFRDWNPDIRWALRRGINIVYSSRTNEIICPSIGISSRTVSSGGSYSGRGTYRSTSSRGIGREHSLRTGKNDNK